MPAPGSTSERTRTRPIELTFFGGPEARVAGEPVKLSPRQAATATILAAHGHRGASRSRLAHLLWSEGDEDAVRQRLSTLLYDLRRALGDRPATRYRGERHLLVLDEVATDIEYLHDLLSERRVREAAELLTRGFIPRLDPPPTEEFREWAREREGRWRAEVLEIAETLRVEAAREADWPRAANAAGVCLDLAPGDENYLRDCMKALALAGEPVAAKQKYNAARHHWAIQHPDWRPEPETLSVFASVDQVARQRHERVFFRQFEGMLNLPLVGRERELAQLLSLLRGKTVTSLQTVVLCGAKGIGLTRLAHEALSATAADGTKVISSQCTPTGHAVPYFALARLLEGIEMSELDGLETPWLQTLSHAAPHLVPAELAGLHRSDPPSSIPALAEALKRLLHRLSLTQPVSLFIDNLHLMDESSSAVLMHLRAQGRALPVSIIGTVDKESVRSTPLAPPVNERLADEHIAQLRIPPLPDDDMHAILDRLLASIPDASPLAPEVRTACEALVQIAQGRPGELVGFVEDVILAHEFPQSFDILDVFQSCLSSYVLRLRDQITPTAREVLSCCALETRPLSLPDLECMVPAALETVAAGAEELVSWGIVCWNDSRLSFPHALLQDLVRGALPLSEQKVLHARLGQYWLERGSANSSRAARHFVAAGQWDLATPLALRAAEETDHRSVNEVIRTLQAVEGMDAPRNDTAEISCALGELLLLTGEADPAIRHFVRSGEDARETGDLATEFRAAIGHVRAKRRQMGFIPDELLGTLQDLKQDMMRSGFTRFLPITLDLELRARAERGDHQGVRELLQGLPNVASTLDQDAADRLMSLRSVGSLYDGFGEASETAQRVFAAASERDDFDLMLKASNWLVILGIQRGTLNLDSGVELRRRAYEIAQRSNHLLNRGKLALNMAVWFLDSGDIDGAEMALERASSIVERHSLSELCPTLLVNEGEVALAQGDFERALARFEKAEGTSAPLPTHPVRLFAVAGKCLAHLGLGHMRKARGLNMQLGSLEVWRPFDTSILFRARAAVVRKMGREAEAAQVLQAGAHQLQGRFNLGWVRLGIERSRLSAVNPATRETLLMFLREYNLARLKSLLDATG